MLFRNEHDDSKLLIVILSGWMEGGGVRLLGFQVSMFSTRENIL